MEAVAPVDMSTVLSIHVWEWSDSPGSMVEISVQRGPDYTYVTKAEARSLHLSQSCARAETALLAWRQAGLIGLVSHFDAFPNIWRYDA
jgi:hypothetical protein